MGDQGGKSRQTKGKGASVQRECCSQTSQHPPPYPQTPSMIFSSNGCIVHGLWSAVEKPRKNVTWFQHYCTAYHSRILVHVSFECFHAVKDTHAYTTDSTDVEGLLTGTTPTICSRVHQNGAATSNVAS